MEMLRKKMDHQFRETHPVLMGELTSVYKGVEISILHRATYKREQICVITYKVGHTIRTNLDYHSQNKEEAFANFRNFVDFQSGLLSMMVQNLRSQFEGEIEDFSASGSKIYFYTWDPEKKTIVTSYCDVYSWDLNLDHISDVGLRDRLKDAIIAFVRKGQQERIGTSDDRL